MCSSIVFSVWHQSAQMILGRTQKLRHRCGFNLLSVESTIVGLFRVRAALNDELQFETVLMLHFSTCLWKWLTPRNPHGKIVLLCDCCCCQTASGRLDATLSSYLQMLYWNLKGDLLLRLAIEWNLEGKRARGRPRWWQTFMESWKRRPNSERSGNVRHLNPL